jgi:hypothetical protein
MAEKEKGKRAGDERAGGSRPDDHRRKWDLAEYEKAAKAREDVEKAMNRYGTEGSSAAILLQADAAGSILALCISCSAFVLKQIWLRAFCYKICSTLLLIDNCVRVRTAQKLPEVPLSRIQIRCRVQI